MGDKTDKKSDATVEIPEKQLWEAPELESHSAVDEIAGNPTVALDAAVLGS